MAGAEEGLADCLGAQVASAQSVRTAGEQKVVGRTKKRAKKFKARRFPGRKERMREKIKMLIEEKEECIAQNSLLASQNLTLQR